MPTPPLHGNANRIAPMPANEQEEADQLAFALRESRIDAMLSSLPSELSNSARMQAEFDFDALPHELKAPYLAMGETGKLKFLEEVMTTHSNTAPLQAAIAQHGMEIVPNDGRTPNGVNNCFMLSVLEHVDGLDRSQHGMLADQFRDILVATPGSGAKHGEPLSAGGAAAKQFVNLINSDPSIKQKLNVEVLSMVGGHLIRDRIDSGSPNAKTVLLIDHGGHFEAVRDLPAAAHAGGRQTSDVTPPHVAPDHTQDAPPPYAEVDPRLQHGAPQTPPGTHPAPHPGANASPEVSTMSGIQQTHLRQLEMEVAQAMQKLRTMHTQAMRTLTSLT